MAKKQRKLEFSEAQILIYNCLIYGSKEDKKLLSFLLDTHAILEDLIKGRAKPCVNRKKEKTEICCVRSVKKDRRQL